MVYPAAPQTRSRGAGAPLLGGVAAGVGRRRQPRQRAAGADRRHRGARRGGDGRGRRAVDEDGIAADSVFVGRPAASGCAGRRASWTSRSAATAPLRRARRRRRGLPALRAAALTPSGPRPSPVGSSDGRRRRKERRMTSPIRSRRGASPSRPGTRTSTPRTARASSGPRSRAPATGSPRSCPNRRRPSRGRAAARKPAPADRVDRTRVGYALETLGAGRTRAIFTVPAAPRASGQVPDPPASWPSTSKHAARAAWRPNSSPDARGHRGAAIAARLTALDGPVGPAPRGVCVS